MRHRQLLAPPRRRIDEPLRGQVVDVVDAVARVGLALARAGLCVEREQALRRAADEEDAARRVEREPARAVLSTRMLPGRHDLPALRVDGDGAVLVLEV